jgi:anthranilate/para-aminobenzoate synthase component I
VPKLAPVPRQIELDLSPAEVAARCADLPGMVFFDSSLADSGSISIVAALPEQVIAGRNWELLRHEIIARRSGIAVDNRLPHGFAAGCVEYEGDFRFGFYEETLIFRHADQSWHATGDLRRHFQPPSSPPLGIPLAFAGEMKRERYMDLVRRAQSYIAAGDIYQVNLAHRFSVEFKGNSFALYQSLRHFSPAPFACFMRLDEERALLSASPESFLRMSGRSIRTRPIKGTRPRFADPVLDERSAYDLLTSAKEVAELIMITDLERNDLGAICEFGSVRASELLKLERYEQVFHLVSTLEGELRTEVDHVEALRRCLPGGSITGAPKIRAMEIIQELEAAPRGIYTGALGWIGFNDESHFNIAIRTIVSERGKAHFHVGAGIVGDSDPAREWEETLHKASGLLLAAEQSMPISAKPPAF